MDSTESVQRIPLHHSAWASKRKPVLIGLFMACVTLQLLFLADLSYLFGSAYKQSTRYSALNILAVDFDGGAIGQALSNSYLALAGNKFPTVNFVSAESFPDPASVKEAVCKGSYWAAVYTHSGASDRLWASVQGETSAYNSSNTITYTYNQARYAAIADGVIMGNLQTLVGAARSFYYQTTNGTAAFSALKNETTTSATALQAYLNPITATADLIMPTTQGVRVLLNTVSMVMPVLAQFFYQMALNGISTEHGILAKGKVSHVWLMRAVIGKLYTLVASLVMSGYIWAFREEWGVDGGQFAVTWMILWLYMDINWLLIDTILVTVVPMPFMSYFILTWIMVNIASTVFPFELQAGWYRIGYALPAHETWSMLVLIWSGCADQKDIALPVLFAWWVVTSITSAWSVRRRCAMAAEQEAAAEAAKRELEGTATEDFENNKSDDVEMANMSRRPVEGGDVPDARWNSRDAYGLRSSDGETLAGGGTGTLNSKIDLADEHDRSDQGPARAL